MIKPSIHLNGTSADALTEAYANAVAALRAAISATEQADPNARDYYPLGHGAFEQARFEHLARLRSLR